MNRIGNNAAAILLAGGRSHRMGEDKCLLDIGGKPLISHVLGQLNQQFDEVIVSVRTTAGYPSLAARVIEDKIPDRGPMMGILSCLEVSNHPTNFVQACDIPDPPWWLVEKLLTAVKRGATVAMPRDREGRMEPLFAVYHKRAIPGIHTVLANHDGAARHIGETCDVAFVNLDAESLPNLNSMKDYLSYMKRYWPNGRP
jgi:molybdopterin-guanine dinucleotide biosynthesis protein A